MERERRRSAGGAEAHSQAYSELVAQWAASAGAGSGTGAGGGADTLLRYLFGTQQAAQAQAREARRTPEETERADERKRRLQRERSRRYRAAKQARRGRRAGDGDEAYEPYFERGAEARRDVDPDPDPPAGDDSDSEGEEPPTLCKPRDEPGRSSCSDSVSDDNSAPGFPEPPPLPKNISINLKEFLSIPNHELDYSTVHSLMFHWLQT